MRDRIERLVLLPFSIGCISESSIAVGEHFPNRPKSNEKLTPIGTKEDDHVEAEEYGDDEEILSDDNSKSQLSLLSIPKLQSIFKNFKNLSQLFAYKDDDMEEDDLSMDIGLPTDVKHVTHIGVDGSATSILSKGWDNLKTADLPVFPPSLDLLIKPAHVPTDFCAYPPPIHSTSSPLSMTAEVSPNLPAAAPVHSAASPFAMLSRVQSHVRSTPSPLAMPAQVHQLNSKGA